MKIYTVLCYRWGHEDGHIYLLGNNVTCEQSEVAAKEHVEDRDGKYDCIVYECLLDSTEKHAVCTYRGLGLNDRVEGEVFSD